MKQASVKRDAFILGSYLLLLFGTTSFMPRLWAWVASHAGPWHRLIPEGIGALLVLSVLRALLRQRSFLLLRSFMLILVTVLFFISMGQLRRPVERIHFGEYGFLSFLVYRLIRHRDVSRWAYVWTLATACAIGCLDELVQGVSPGRVYDLRDIGFNSLASVFGLVAVILLVDPFFLR